ncbi:hypothetical protein [Rhodococcus sp. NPDC047139]
MTILVALFAVGREGLKTARSIVGYAGTASDDYWGRSLFEA